MLPRNSMPCRSRAATIALASHGAFAEALAAILRGIDRRFAGILAFALSFCSRGGIGRIWLLPGSLVQLRGDQAQ